jgi:ABC-type antimicrobial peptide transport system permease subunit
MIIFNEGQNAHFEYITIRPNNQDIRRSIALFEKIYKTYNPDFPFDVHFLDQDYKRQYIGHKKANTLVGLFAMLGIFISCMGLYGLSSLLTQQRTKEIGIRKVNGATSWSIGKMLSSCFLKYVLIAICLALPLSYIVTKSWLTNFAYKTSMAWWVFLGAGIITIFIALMTVGYQTIKAARKNPVDVLRYE